MYAARKRCAIARCRLVWCVFRIVGRAISPAVQATRKRPANEFGGRLPPVCRGRMHAARKCCAIARCRLVWCLFRIVGRAFTPAAAGRFCIVTTFGPCVGAAYMPPAKRCGRWPSPGRMVCVSYCRAGDFARRTLLFLKIFNVRRGQDPALQSGVNGRVSREPRVGQTPAGRHVCRPYK